MPTNASSVRVVVRLPWNRPEDAEPDPPRIEWTPEKADILWRVIEKSRSSDSGGADWKGLAAHLEVPLPYLLYRVNARFQEDIRGLKDIQGALSPSPVAATNPKFEALMQAERPSLSIHTGVSSSKISISSRQNTPRNVRARLNSLVNNSPRPKKAISSSTITVQGPKRQHVSIRPQSPLSSDSDSYSGDDDEAALKEEEAERVAEEQETLERKLQELSRLITSDTLGLVHSHRSKRSIDRGRAGLSPNSTNANSAANSFRGDSLSSRSDNQSLSSSGVPVSEQGIHFGERELTDPKKTMQGYGIPDDSMLLLRRKGANVGGRTIEQDAEMMRLQILGDPNLMRQIQEVRPSLTYRGSLSLCRYIARQTQPELAAAAQSDSRRFAELLRQTAERQREAEFARQREYELLESDPFNIEAQQKIEEHIRQQAVLENMEHALEFSPESFGRVTMLYIPVEVNSHPVKAFVDSGAQQTIMSPECAEACGIMRLVDKRFAGIARGVGTAKILGRVHSAQLKLSDLYLPCSFTIMEGRDVDLLFGLDMLRAHQACIDLSKNVLRIQGREVPFLSEHELPDKARFMEGPEEPVSSSIPGGSGNPGSASGSGGFPGSGQTLGSTPGAIAPTQPPRANASPARFPEASIQTLMGLGVTRDEAIRALEAAGGNVDVAASFLF
ncbi:hypothetical protein NP233_g568 [Leucocoprinus birnbaumii]|uniref:DNA damage-inducible protein 1 n=1 Tax=Leucocoprinus birnbaumii TaxID=56174 RepID=A0AAD5W1L7_9AGAR|nr:hypothetical protein NP233_g568 [Leucocoprinus birnbaumii]